MVNLYQQTQNRRWCLIVAVVLSFVVPRTADTQEDSGSSFELHPLIVAGSQLDDNCEIIEYLAMLTDIELEKTLDMILNLPDFRSRAGYEPCLNEIIRRGAEHWELFLQNRYETLIASEIKQYVNADTLTQGAMFNLEILTALRRVNQQPDPLQIVITEPEAISGMGSVLPQLEVKIINLDVEKSSVGFTVGGAYRSGRQERWRIVVQDEDGQIIPVRTHLGFFGGGWSMRELLEHGQSWKTSLDVRSFIELPPPGNYVLTVQYHNTQHVAGRDNVDGLILSQSRPVPFIVKPLTIVQSRDDRDTVRRLVAELDGSRSLKIVAGTYGKWAYEFIPPDSPEGQLLSMGLVAVPTIIESLHNDALTNEKRAWLLGILFSLTSENDPRQGSALGSYQYFESGWQIWSSVNGEASSGGLSFGSKGFSSGGEVDRIAQETLISSWDNWLKKVKISE